MEIKTREDKYRERYPILLRFPVGGIDCGEGWDGIIDELFSKIVKTDPECYLTQIKEKFGRLRVYTGSTSDEVYDLIDAAESMSEITCETCGKPGVLNSERYLKTACDEHR